LGKKQNGKDKKSENSRVFRGGVGDEVVQEFKGGVRK